MLKPNSALRTEAYAALQGNWLMAAVTTLINMAVAAILGNIPWIGWIAVILISPVLGWGLYTVFYDLFREHKLVINTLFGGFNDYKRVLGTMLLVQVYTFLWTLLLIVPGIIKGCSYAMTPFILREHPELSYNAAIEKSMAMMEGNKMKFFLLCLSFIGWAILCLLTLGIGYLFLYPYIYTSFVAFYEDLKAQQGEAAAAGAFTQVKDTDE